MIGKVVIGSSFKGLARYLAGDSERVAWMRGINVFEEDPTRIGVTLESCGCA